MSDSTKLARTNKSEVEQVKEFIGDDIPNSVYLHAPLQWKIGAGRAIREPYLACKQETLANARRSNSPYLHSSRDRYERTDWLCDSHRIEASATFAPSFPEPS